VLSSQLILTALEAGGAGFQQSPALIRLVQDDVCRFLLRNARSSNTLVLALTFRILFNLLVLMREHLSQQLEIVINTVYLRILTSRTPPDALRSPSSSSIAIAPSDGAGGLSVTYDVKELTLESLLDLCRVPWFLAELFLNYDCQPYSTDLFTNLFQTLCKNSIPVHQALTGNHVLALQAVVAGLRVMSQRCVHAMPASSLSGSSAGQHQAPSRLFSPFASPLQRCRQLSNGSSSNGTCMLLRDCIVRVLSLTSHSSVLPSGFRWCTRWGDQR